MQVGPIRVGRPFEADQGREHARLIVTLGRLDLAFPCVVPLVAGVQIRER